MVTWAFTFTVPKLISNSKDIKKSTFFIFSFNFPIKSLTFVHIQSNSSNRLNYKHIAQSVFNISVRHCIGVGHALQGIGFQIVERANVLQMFNEVLKQAKGTR